MQEVLHARLHHARLWLFPPLILGQRQWQVLINSVCLFPYLSLFHLLQFSNSNSSQMKVQSSFISERDIYLATWPRGQVILKICTGLTKSFNLFSENSNCTESIYTQYDVSSRSCDCPAACEQVHVDSGYHWSSQNHLAKFWKLTLKIIDNKSIETFQQNALPHLINCHYQHISSLYIIYMIFLDHISADCVYLRMAI